MRSRISCSPWIASAVFLLALGAIGCTNHNVPETGAGNPAPDSQFGASGSGHRTPPAGTYTPTTGTDFGNPAGEAGQPVNTQHASRAATPAATRQ